MRIIKVGAGIEGEGTLKLPPRLVWLLQATSSRSQAKDVKARPLDQRGPRGRWASSVSCVAEEDETCPMKTA